MMDCIFCKIIAGEIPCTKLYEDDHIFAFLDINPVYKGHTLVVPKHHCVNIHDMPRDVLDAFFEGVQKMASAVNAGVGTQGVNLIMNNGGDAGQIVFHAHMHIIPRTAGSKFPGLPHNPYNEGEDKEFAMKIQAQF